MKSGGVIRFHGQIKQYFGFEQERAGEDGKNNSLPDISPAKMDKPQYVCAIVKLIMMIGRKFGIIVRP